MTTESADFNGGPSIAAPYILQVVSGPHSGARMALFPGVYRIGRNFDCDIVIQEDSLSAGSIILEVPASGAMTVSGSGADFKIRKPKLPETQTPGNITGTIIETGSTVIVISPQKLFNGAPEALHLAAVNQGKKVARRQNSFSFKKIRTAFIVTALIAAAVPVALYLAVTLVPQTLSPHKDPAAYRLKVTRFLADRGIDSLTYSTDSSGPSVNGYVSTTPVRQEITALLNRKFPDLTVKIRADEEIAISVRKIIDMSTVYLNADYMGRGHVVIRGLCDDMAYLHDLRDQILNSVEGVNEMELQVFGYREFASLLKSSVAQNGLTGAVSFSSDNGRLVAFLHTSMTSNRLMDRWAKQKAYVTDTLGVWLTEDWTNSVGRCILKTSIERTSIEYAGIMPMSGGEFCIVMPDGRRLFTGAATENRYKIYSVQNNIVVLGDGKNIITLFF